MGGDIKERLPAAYDMEQAAISYPVLWEQSMNTVLCQELARFNNLTNAMKKSLVEVEKAVRGIVVMSGPLEALGDSLVYGAIPAMWKAKSYPSFKPLAGYVTDLLERLNFLNEWLCEKPPSPYWISAFFFQHAFMTASKQNYSRAETIPIDAISLQFEMLPSSSYAKPPALGVYVYGFFFEGARWDKKQKKILESEPKVLHDCSSHVVPTEKDGADPAPSLIFMPGLQDGRPAGHPRDYWAFHKFYLGHLRAERRSPRTLGPARRGDAVAARRLRR